MQARVALAVMALLAAPACARGGIQPGGKPVVVTGVFPFEEVARHVGGDRVTVVDVASPGAEPHDIELTAAQVGEVENADVVLSVRGLQPALDAAAKDKATLDALALVGGDDPHVWLDPVLLTRIALALADRLGTVDKANAAAYRAGADAYVGDLTALHDQMTGALARCARKDVVTSHAAFGRFAARYGLRQTAISGVDPDAEPSPHRLAEVVSFVKSNGVTTVFAESSGDKTAKTVAREAGAVVAVLDPAEIDRGVPYIGVMGANVVALRTALDCR